MNNVRGKWFKIIGFSLALIILSIGGYAAFMFAVSPAAIRTPKVEHAHLRMQLVVDGEPVNFGDAKFQQTYEKGVCSALLPETPIHLHDNVDQFVHLHWKGMTGGLVLKNYGWDLIGGPDNQLGYRLDELPNIKKVPTYGNVLPPLPKDLKLWVYTGNVSTYNERAQSDFVNQDFETFFGKKSPINPDGVSLLDKIFPRAYAHDNSGHKAESDAGSEKLERINNLLGDVVVFAQQEKPSDQQIKARFQKLETLTESVCGG